MIHGEPGKQNQFPFAGEKRGFVHFVLSGRYHTYFGDSLLAATEMVVQLIGQSQDCHLLRWL